MDVASCLPEDVLLDIFCRLPKEALLRCEAVSKNWQNLIGKTASFSARAVDFGFVDYCYYDDFSKEEVHFNRLDAKGSVRLQDTLVIPSRQSIRNIGSSNGFLFYFKEDPRNFNLYNPVTKQLTSLPPPPPSVTGGDLAPLGMGFAPNFPETNYYRFLVFYDPDHGVMHKRSHFLRVAIFDSETREWTAKGSIRAQFRPLRLGAATLYCRGTLYWLLEPLICLRVFCLKTETFRLLRLPKARDRYLGVLWESEGSIHYCLFCKVIGLCIWVLEENPNPAAGSGPNNIITGTRCDDHSWRKIYCLPKTTLNSILAQAAIGKPGAPQGPVLYKIGHRRPIRIARVCGFNKHLQILLLQTTQGPVLCDISAKAMSPFSGSFESLKDKIRIEFLPFTFNNTELPDINEPTHQPECSATTSGDTSRKRRRA